MKRSKTETAVMIAVDTLVAYWLLSLLFPSWRLYLRAYVGSRIRWQLWALQLKPYLREAYQVRGVI